MKLTRLYCTSVVINVLLFVVLYIFLPNYRNTLVTEDGFLENLTAFFFGSSFLVGLRLVWRLKNQPHQKIYFGLPILGLLGFLDEISFGLYMFEREVPTVNEVPVDALHDVLDIIFRISIETMNPLFVHVSILLAGYGLIFIVLKVHKVYDRYPPFEFVAVAVIFLCIAAIIDLEIVRYHFLFFLEELFEMNAALALVFACLATQHLEKPKRSSRTLRKEGTPKMLESVGRRYHSSTYEISVGFKIGCWSLSQGGIQH